MRYRKLERGGFTIIELLIATVVSSVLIMSVLVAFVQISRYFTKGLTQATTQKVARSVIENISQKIQTTTGGITLPFVDSSGFTLFCINHSRFSYQKVALTDAGEIGAQQHWERTLYIEEDLESDVGQSVDACRTGGGAPGKAFTENGVRGALDSSGNPIGGTGKNMLGDNMLVTGFILAPVDSSPSPRLYRLAISILNAPNDAKTATIIDTTTVSDIFGEPTGVCNGTGTAGGEFCGLSIFETNAFRLNKLKY